MWAESWVWTLTSQRDKTLCEAAVSETQEFISCLAPTQGRVDVHTRQCANANCVIWWLDDQPKICFCSRFDHNDVVWSRCCTDTVAPCAFSSYHPFGRILTLRIALPLFVVGWWYHDVCSGSRFWAAGLCAADKSFYIYFPSWSRDVLLGVRSCKPWFWLELKRFWSNRVLHIFEFQHMDCCIQ